MPHYAYERLGFLDNSFLIMEGPTTPMHVAGTATYEVGPLRTPEGGIDIDRIRGYVSSRLHLIPRYRQRLAFIPLENHAVWIDDFHFNIHYHVRHTALPRPGYRRDHLRRGHRTLLPQQVGAEHRLDGQVRGQLTQVGPGPRGVRG